MRWFGVHGNNLMQYARYTLNICHELHVFIIPSNTVIVFRRFVYRALTWNVFRSHRSFEGAVICVRCFLCVSGRWTSSINRSYFMRVMSNMAVTLRFWWSHPSMMRLRLSGILLGDFISCSWASHLKRRGNFDKPVVSLLLRWFEDQTECASERSEINDMWRREMNRFDIIGGKSMTFIDTILALFSQTAHHATKQYVCSIKAVFYHDFWVRVILCFICFICSRSREAQLGKIQLRLEQSCWKEFHDEYYTSIIPDLWAKLSGKNELGRFLWHQSPISGTSDDKPHS